MTTYEDEDEVLIEAELEDFNFVEKDGEVATWWSSGCYAIKKIPTLHKDIRFSTQGVQ